MSPPRPLCLLHADFARLVASNEDSASTPADEVYSLLVKVIGDWPDRP